MAVLGSGRSAALLRCLTVAVSGDVGLAAEPVEGSDTVVSWTGRNRPHASKGLRYPITMEFTLSTYTTINAVASTGEHEEIETRSEARPALLTRDNLRRAVPRLDTEHSSLVLFGHRREGDEQKKLTLDCLQTCTSFNFGNLDLILS
jgi:hypothetical protein